MATVNSNRLSKILNHLSSNNCGNNSKYRILITGVYYPCAPRIYKHLLSMGHDVVLLSQPKNYKDAKETLLYHLDNVRNDYDAIMNAWTLSLEKSVLKKLPNLKVVSCISSGTNNVDVEYCKSVGIPVKNIPSALSETVADMVLGMILATCRNIVSSSNTLRKKGVQILQNPITSNALAFAERTKDLHECTVGLVGLGGIGRQVSKRLAFGFGCKVIYCEAFGRMQYDVSYGAKYVDSFDKLLSESDIVVPLCPLLPTTRKMFNDRAFKLMKKDAIFINVSRGGVCDTDALVRALKNGEILQAGIDVTDPEPLPVDHELWTLPNVTITPHIGSATEPCRNRMIDMATENMLNVLNSK